MGLGDLFKSKKDKAIQRAHHTGKDNVSRVKALDLLEEHARGGDEACLDALFRCFQITVKTDKQEQGFSPYDDEAEKKGLIDRLREIEDRPRVLAALRKELARPPWMTPGRRDGIVWLVELLRALAEDATNDDDEAADLVVDELCRALAAYDPEETYRTNERKVELVKALGRHRSEKAASAILPYLADVDETVRSVAVDALATAGDAQLGESLAKVLLDDESLRNRQRAGDVMADLEVAIKGHPRRKEIETALPPDAMVDKQGVVRRRSGG